jgi:hypothetical protein
MKQWDFLQSCLPAEIEKFQRAQVLAHKQGLEIGRGYVLVHHGAATPYVTIDAVLSYLEKRQGSKR